MSLTVLVAAQLQSGGGILASAFGSVSAGALVWGQNSFDVAFGDGGLYNITIEQGIDLVAGVSRTIYADITLEVAPVPLPASALLLIAGLGGLGAMRLRRKAA